MDDMTTTDVIRQSLQHYSDRGVFQGFAEIQGRGDKTVFSFRWLLGSEFTLLVDLKKSELVVKNLLPEIENYSFIDADLRKFTGARSDPKLPRHRRLDPDRAILSYTNRKQNGKQNVSLVVRVVEDEYGYALRMLLSTLNDLFTYLHLYHVDYLQQNFRVPEE
jgi:hypothetical protein